MFSLFKRELKSLILKPFTMAVFVLLFLVPAIIFSVFLSIGPDGTEAKNVELVYAGFENLISIAGLFFAAVIPAVVIFVIRAERKEKNFNYLISLPLSRKSIMRAKFFALVTYFVLPLCVVAFYPLVFSAYGEVNFLQCYLALLMLALLVMFLVAFSFMVAVKKTNVITASVISYAAIILSYTVGVISALVRFLPFGTGFNLVLDEILSELSIFKKLDKSVLELFYWSDAIFFIVGIIVFVMIASFSYGKEFLRTEKKPRNKKKVAVICSSFVLVLCLAFVPTLLPYSARALDVSDSELYSTDGKLDKFFDTIDEDITIYLINPYSGNDELYNVILRTVERNDRINLEIVDPMEDTEIMEKYGLATDDPNTLSAMSYAMVVQGERRYKVVNPSEYYLFSNGVEHLTSAELESRYTQYLNEYIDVYTALYSQIQSNNLSESQKALLEQSEKKIMSLEKDFAERMNVEATIASAIEYVTVYPIAYSLTGHGEAGTTSNIFDLSANKEIPRDAEVLIINSPSEDYDNAEIDILKEYVDCGGKLYILADKENYSMPNFSALLNAYGIFVDGAVITEANTEIIDVAINKKHEAFGSGVKVDTVKLVGASKIYFHNNGLNYTYDELLSYVETEGEGESAVEKGRYPVAVSVYKGAEKKVVLVTGAKTFNEITAGITEDELGMSSMAFLYSVTWLYENDFKTGVPEVVPKAFQKTPYVTTTGDVIKSVIIFDVVIPAAVLFSALVYMLSRKLRSQRGKNGNPETY